MDNIIYSSEKIMPYVYFGIHEKTGYFYFGCRTSKKQKYPSHLDLYKYKTSSKYVKEIGFNNFKWFILAEFFNPEHALDFEEECINSFWKHPLSLNFQNRGKNFSTTGLSNCQQHRKKISNADYSSRRGIKPWHNNRKNSKWYHSDTKNYMLFENDPLIKMLNLSKGRKKICNSIENNISNNSEIKQIIKFTNCKQPKIRIKLKGSKLYHSINGDHFLFNENDQRVNQLNLKKGKFPGTHHKATLGRNWYYDEFGKTYSLFPNDEIIKILNLNKGRRKK